jgi:DNA-binding beta-propeller fold protein YncE
MSLVRFTSSLALALVVGTGCFGGNDKPPTTDPPPDDGGPVLPPPVGDPPPPAPGVYKRGSLTPIYQLMPRSEYGRLTEGGVTMADADFISNAGNFVSATQKLDELGAQIGRERGQGNMNLIPRAEDRQRAIQIPFRGNPSDVDLIRVNGRRKAYVPLGGDLMTPGNEIASVDLATGLVTRIKVGVRPQRIAVHPAGLIFVCNQFSNYITIIDPRTDTPLVNGTGPVEIKTEFYCTDLLFVPRNPSAPDEDEQDLYIANNWRGSVLKYGLTVDRDGLSNEPTNVRVTNPTNPSPESQPAAEITTAGANPYRLSLSQDLRSIFVANNRGGELAKIDIASNNVRRIAVKGPVPDIAQANDVLIVPTTTIDRGLPAREDQLPQQIAASPAIVTGLDGQSHVAHPGALFDTTKAYNFEDLRNGMLTLDAQLTQGAAPVYFTDSVSREPNFVAQQKILRGTMPQAVVVNAAKNRAFIAMSGSNVIQQISIRAGAFRIADAGAALIQTETRPFALALDEQVNEILVADWGSEILEVFDITSGARKQRIDLGYATARYPATNIERGEFLFYNTSWSNNAVKSCAQCHADELLLDGVGYANGATAPNAFHKVPANFNLLTTHPYFWNGSFSNGSYTSLAADAQTRTNCELILFGLTEGMASNPATRVGDAGNRVASAQSINCRPQTVPGQVLPANFDAILQIIAAEKLVRDQVVQGAVGVSFATASRLVDFYSLSEMRLPPNPLTYLLARNEVDGATAAKVAQGKTLFTQAGCNNCHQPDNARHPFTDGRNHGAGVEWTSDFVDTYTNDQRLINLITSIPQVLLEAITEGPADREINIHLDPIDFFIPFCFELQSCLVFEDPIAVRGNLALETQRLDALIKVNLANDDRGFIPGNPRGQPMSNTPSLRGMWYQTNFLRHGHAHSLKEAVLAPGHPALNAGELGYAVDALGNRDVHGTTSRLTKDEVEALNLYVTSIE